MEEYHEQWIDYFVFQKFDIIFFSYKNLCKNLKEILLRNKIKENLK